MKSIKKICIGGIVSLLVSACSVQQFAVNTQTEPFQNGGRIWGEKTQKCGEGGWKLETKKGGDLHVLGINVKKSDTKKMVEQLGAKSYTIETKSNLWVDILTWGMVDYKVVKIIKREN